MHCFIAWFKELVSSQKLGIALIEHYQIVSKIRIQLAENLFLTGCRENGKQVGKIAGKPAVRLRISRIEQGRKQGSLIKHLVDKQPSDELIGWTLTFMATEKVRTEGIKGDGPLLQNCPRLALQGVVKQVRSSRCFGRKHTDIPLLKRLMDIRTLCVDTHGLQYTMIVCTMSLRHGQRAPNEREK
ncbi:hypothetical protein SDC9_115916 [bioreactor metagenome]|uniref:Uncharacterized protein n=1 Tax=bioreactor metagenome TaxID=1076179 RepID=A0A645BU74_9ZZZZ